MAGFQFDEKALEKQMKQQSGKIEAEANRAAGRESTPSTRAQAFARVLWKHGVQDVDEAELRRKFGG